MRESEFQSRIIKMLERRNAQVLNVHGHAMQKSGWPDIYVAHTKWTGWVEFKVDERMLTDLQRDVIRRLRERGVHAVEMHLWTEGQQGTAEENPGCPQLCGKPNLVSVHGGETVAKFLLETLDYTNIIERLKVVR